MLHAHKSSIISSPIYPDLNLSNAHTTPIRKHPRSHIHRPQLLEQQLRRIRNDNLRDPRLVFARSALELSLAEFRDGRHETADLANVDPESVADV